jgi:FkbM family methyltransferase
LEAIPLPARWLDIGCNFGLFSLWLASLRLKHGLDLNFNALLIDADSRAEQAVQKLIDINRLEQRMVFKHGAISPDKTKVLFSENENMWASGLAGIGHGKGKLKEVPVIDAKQIRSILPPPYDLIKLDIEGAEIDFFAGYNEILSETKYLLFEDHSIHFGHPEKELQCRRLLEDKGFKLIREYDPSGGTRYNVKLYQNAAGGRF